MAKTIRIAALAGDGIGKEVMGGVQKRLLPEASVYEALLEEGDAQVTINGIAALGARYNSERLRMYRQLMGKNVRVDFLYDPSQTNIVYWRTPDGVFDKLQRDRKGNESVGTASSLDVKTYHLRLAAAAEVERKNSRRKPKEGSVLTARQRKLLLDAAGLKPRKQRATPTKEARGVRAIEAKYQQEARPVDHAEKAAPQLNPQPPAMPDAVPEASRLAAKPAVPPQAQPAQAPQVAPPSPCPPSSSRLTASELFRLRRTKAASSEG